MQADLRVVRFKPWHYGWLATRVKAEGGMNFPISDDLLAQLEAQNSWTGVVDGEPMVCAGTIQQWRGRHTAWAYVARGTLPYMAWITENVNANLAFVTGRVEFTVRADFKAGHRWARLLGFYVETPLMKSYGPSGEDHVGYVRFNEVG